MTRNEFFLICVAATLTSGVLSFAQQGRREIVSDDFTKPRPASTPKPMRPGSAIGGHSGLAMPRPTAVKHYRFAASAPPNALPLSATDNVRLLGLTLWRLRPASNIESGQRLLIREQGKSAEWIPERIEMDTPLRTGDRVRLSVESPHVGYLYVIDRHLYVDGKLGEAVLLFPKRGRNNQVRPGKLIDLPAPESAEEASANYFTTLSSRDQVGKVLTIIVTSAPLDLATGDQPTHISAAELAKWEQTWGSESERFELEGGAGKAWTKEEKEAAAADSTEQLTQGDPLPQTIYRIALKDKTAFLANIRLSYTK